MNAVNVTDLRKNYGEIEALKGVSFAVERGEIYSLLGPNGAGKTTTLAILAGLLGPNRGKAEIFGHTLEGESSRVKQMIGVVPQDIALYEDLTARENLQFWGRMYGLSGSRLHRRVDELLELMELTSRRKDKIETFSGGMKRRINIAAALLHEPELLIMDEPTVGIDPQSRRYILDNVKKLNAGGITVLYTTHYMEEAQELSHRIAIMDAGRIIAQGTHDELVKIIGALDRIILTTQGPAPADAWRSLIGVEEVSAEGSHTVVLTRDADSILPGIFEKAREAGVHISSMEVQEPNLEAVFLHLTGHELRD
mgnify:CR=1 FL=1